MNKTILQKRIEERARERFENELRNLTLLVAENDVGRLLEVTGKDDTKILIMNDRGGSNTSKVYLKSYLGNNHTVKYVKEHTNIEEVENKLMERYIKEETDKILSKIDDLDYLFEEKK